MNPTHENCGGQLHTPRIYFRKGSKIVSEKLDNIWFCKKCKKLVKLTGTQKEAVIDG